jgi:sec-independent protein translocase protein TatC
MKTNYSKDEDLFKETTMTFGEHLEELRVALFKSLIGIVIGFIIGLYFGDQIVAAIKFPLESALGRYYVNGAVDGYEAWANSRQAQGLSVPYTLDQVKGLVENEGWLYEIDYVDPSQMQAALREAAGTPAAAPAPPVASENAAAPSTSPDTASTADAPAAPPLAPSSFAPVFAWHPMSDDERVSARAFGTTESFGIYMKASLIAGVVLASPWVFYQIWSFVAAGLYPHEKKYVHVFLPFSLGLFLLGAATAYFFAFSYVLDYLFWFNRYLGLPPEPRINEWLSFVLLLPLGFGISFQLPLVMLFLERIGIFDAKTYIQKLRMAILVVFILSAILTPADPSSMLLMAIPLTFLYFLGIFLCYRWPRSQPAST